jgi:hypothetical protein
MVLKKLFVCIFILLCFSCEDPMTIMYPENTGELSTEKIRNYTNVNNEGKGEFEGNATIIVNNSTWPIKANIYKANEDRALLRTVHMNSRGDNYTFYDPSTITITYAPIYIELTDYKSYIKANLSTKNYIYFLNN